MSEQSLASLFASVKQELENKKKKPEQKHVKLKWRGIKPTEGLLTDEVVVDEWDFTTKQQVSLLDAIEWRPAARVMVTQNWLCQCGGHGTTHLGFFVSETSYKTHSRRLRPMAGTYFSFDEQALPLEHEQWDVQLVAHCPSCIHLGSGTTQLLLVPAEPPKEELVKLAGEVVEQMLVAKPGFDEYGSRIITRAVIDREEQEPTQAELDARPWAVIHDDEEE